MVVEHRFTVAFAVLTWAICLEAKSVFAPPMERSIGDSIHGIGPQVTTGCPEVVYVNSTDGFIYTPSFPSFYPNNVMCEYVIQGPDNGTVQIDFFVLSVENCCDFVAVYDGPTTDDSALIKRFSGKITNSTSTLRTTKSNSMTIVFTSDENVNEQGFYAVFSVSSTWPTTPADQTKVEENLTSPFGALVSPNFPGEYPANADAKYLIGNGTAGTVVQITTEFFSTEGCCDKVYIYDDKTANDDNLLIVLSGDSPVVGYTYTSSNPYLYIEFSTDNNDEQQGFSFMYKIIADPANAAAAATTEVGTAENLHPIQTNTNFKALQKLWGIFA
uniref:CUB domain-containing protein n=1 Tax=Panagrellus redivivus TaxID=6233 RepID=A0A7E4W2Y1_PANRE